MDTVKSSPLKGFRWYITSASIFIAVIFGLFYCLLFLLDLLLGGMVRDIFSSNYILLIIVISGFISIFYQDK